MVVDLPALVEAELGAFVAGVAGALGADLVSVVLFGSGAEGRLRATSDVNVLVLLRRFRPEATGAIAPVVERARLVINLRPMWILEAELPAAAEAFAVKYSDITQRHRVLHGGDPFVGLVIPRAATIARLRQVLLNLTLRLRAQVVEAGTSEDRLAPALAEAAGPLRVAAATLLELEGEPAAAPREALAAAAGREGPRFAAAAMSLSTVRAGGTPEPGAARASALALLDLAMLLSRRAEAVRP